MVKHGVSCMTWTEVMAMGSDNFEKLERLAKIAGVVVKHSKAYQLEGKPCLLCGSGFHQIYNPYKNKEQAFDILFKAGMELSVEEDTIVYKNGVIRGDVPIEHFDKPWHALCYAICEGALK